MKIILNPENESWELLCTRPGIEKTDLEKIVRAIIDGVKSGKDKAVQEYSAKYDGTPSGKLKVSAAEKLEAEGQIPESLKSAIITAKNNIEKFHSSQLETEQVVETAKGVKCWRKNVAVEKNWPDAKRL